MEKYNIEEYIKKRNWSEEEFNTYMRIIENFIENNNINKEKLKELKRYFNLNTNFWCFIEWVNCYAYALGIDLPPECFNIYFRSSYQPGCFFEAINQTKLEKTGLEERLEMDFEVLEFDYRMISPDEKIAKDEWKIALLNKNGDYHFLREGNDGTWYHKPGYYKVGIPTNKDGKGNIITNPLTVYFKSPVSDCNRYKYNRCYSLRMR